MVMSAQPVFDALRSVDAQDKRILYMSPRGRKLDRDLVTDLAAEENLVILCGHYEGIDERIIDFWKPEEISIGDYILTGEKLAAMVVVDAVARMIPSVLGNQEFIWRNPYTPDSSNIRSIRNRESMRRWKCRKCCCPAIISSSICGKFEKACEITKERRPDLWEAFVGDLSGLTKDERKSWPVCAERKQSAFISDGKAAGRGEFCGGLLRRIFRETGHGGEYLVRDYREKRRKKFPRRLIIPLYLLIIVW